MLSSIDWIDIAKLFAALIAGSLIGAEREYHSKSAGLRTIALICVGSTIFTILSFKMGVIPNQDRFAANIITGIGFLGAGVIFKEENRVTGLTTAAIIWIAAAIGVAIGAGEYAVAFAGLVITVGVQQFFLILQTRIDAINQMRNYTIMCKFQDQTLQHYEEIFEKFDLVVYRGKQSLNANIIKGEWQLEGSKECHEKCVSFLLKDKEILELEF
ncbi:MAG TPA: MgtC/SapB family protein [Ferruginibacter sp.]|jgi:putative Mg2+ transporter-C (MgtC) family protein|nr:MgtC/SapB family protein [Ferruginibacter sp.]